MYISIYMYLYNKVEATSQHKVLDTKVELTINLVRNLLKFD